MQITSKLMQYSMRHRLLALHVTELSYAANMTCLSIGLQAAKWRSKGTTKRARTTVVVPCSARTQQETLLCPNRGLGLRSPAPLVLASGPRFPPLGGTYPFLPASARHRKRSDLTCWQWCAAGALNTARCWLLANCGPPKLPW